MLSPYRLLNWLERRWVVPAYSGWVMGGLALFFFAAATNTMAGWLYVMSGVMMALLGMAAILPGRSLQRLQVSRRSLDLVSVGDLLTVELAIENGASQPKTLLQIKDMLPSDLGQPQVTAIESIPAHSTYYWTYACPTERRGVYRWQGVELRTATPLGLFWCRRQQTVKAVAVIYPRALPLSRCPLVDELGQDDSQVRQSNARAQAAVEGVTRTLRPYRWGDPTRLVHWRTSARYGELRVRELETFTGGLDVVICLDSALGWEADQFEQAVTAAASLYAYASQQGMQVSLWTAGTGIVKGDRTVLKALAAVRHSETPTTDAPPGSPLIWLTQNAISVNTLPQGSRWLLWPAAHFNASHSNRSNRSEPGGMTDAIPTSRHPGLVIQLDSPLRLQLQLALQG